MKSLHKFKHSLKDFYVCKYLVKIIFRCWHSIITNTANIVLTVSYFKTFIEFYWIRYNGFVGKLWRWLKWKILFRYLNLIIENHMDADCLKIWTLPLFFDFYSVNVLLIDVLIHLFKLNSISSQEIQLIIVKI